MTECVIPLTDDPRQVMTLDLTLDGDPFHARIEVRCLPAPDLWVLSLWDNANGELLLNQIPLICSYGEINDLAAPFRHLRDGKGVGSLFVIRATDEPTSENPGKSNLTQFKILLGDTICEP